MKFRLLFLLAGVIGSLGLQPSPAGASTHMTPPPANTCVSTGRAVKVDDPGGLIATAAVIEVTAVVTCQLDGALTEAPDSYLGKLPYKGDIVAGVLINGQSQPCTGTPSGYFYAVGPTLVMATSAVCVFSVDRPSNTPYSPVVWWATMDFHHTSTTPSGYTSSSAPVPFV